MLELAYKHEEKLKELFMESWYEDKYKYYFASRWHTGFELPKPSDGDWNGTQFVSVDKDKNVLGYLDFSVNRDDDLVSNIGIINFSNNKVIFGKDIAKLFDDIFCKFKYRKIEFVVVCGNPIERSYDRMVHKFGGRIVGVLKKHVIIMGNEMCDEKLYEIFREDYLKAKGEN